MASRTAMTRAVAATANGIANCAIRVFVTLTGEILCEGESRGCGFHAEERAVPPR
jgi:hypothetical protein